MNFFLFAETLFKPSQQSQWIWICTVSRYKSVVVLKNSTGFQNDWIPQIRTFSSRFLSFNQNHTATFCWKSLSNAKFCFSQEEEMHVPSSQRPTPTPAKKVIDQFPIMIAYFLKQNWQQTVISFSAENGWFMWFWGLEFVLCCVSAMFLSFTFLKMTISFWDLNVLSFVFSLGKMAISFIEDFWLCHISHFRETQTKGRALKK